MLCDRCHSRPATIHFTKIVNGQKEELNLCPECAAQEQGAVPFSFYQPFNIAKFLAGLMGGFGTPVMPGAAPEAAGAAYAPPAVNCPSCGYNMAQFSQTGLLGCPECYKNFADQLNPLIRRVHGSNVHQGKIPKRAAEHLDTRRKVELLRQELNQLIAREEYEKAAEVRDKIRELEKELGQNKEA